MIDKQFPMFRLATLLARQLSSPLATRIKSYAVSHPRFGTAVCVKLAEAFNNCEWRTKVWTLRLAGVRLPAQSRPPPLPQQTAIDLGGNLLGEAIIFVLGSCIVIFEVNRQGANKELKELEEESQWLVISLSLEELKREVNLQQDDLQRLHSALLYYMQTKQNLKDGKHDEHQQSQDIL